MTYKRYIHILIKITSYILEIFYLLIFYIYARRKYKDKNIFLISERGFDARDNGMHLFQYIRKNYPNQSIYFVIDKNSSDIDNVRPYGNIILKKTLKHILMFYGAKVLISTHIMGGYTTNQSFYMRFHKYSWFKKNRTIVFLQHGIIKDDLPQLYGNKISLDLFICGAKKEYEYINSHFCYKNNEVRYTGLARFDVLSKHKETNQILIMPTWRHYLDRLTQTEFEKSEYFIMWNKILKDNKIINLLNKYQLNLIFYPHYEIQKYIHSFCSSHPKIIIADMKQYDVQTLLMQSKLLITDFSSVYFDFAYMLKPVIYYQFDKEKFFKTHYKKGYFDYNTMGFGPVLSNSDEVIKAISVICAQNFIIDSIYKKRMDEFFPIKDNNNCKRIYEAIVSVYSKSKRIQYEKNI